MAVIHKPELGGAKAVYVRSTDEEYRTGEGGITRRDIIGWDRSGRPLVVCGGRLYPAKEAPFEHFRDYATVEQVDVVTLIENVVHDYLTNRLFDSPIQRTFLDAIEESVNRIARERMGVAS